MRRVTVAIVVALGLVSCARPPLDSYDTSCGVDDDCAFVSTSQSCDCRCGDTVINVDEVERFEREQAPFCPLPTVVDCLCAVAGPAVCADGACAIGDGNGGADG